MEDQSERIEILKQALLLLLDNIDYEAGNCRVNEMIGAVLPKEILRKAWDGDFSPISRAEQSGSTP